jgi:hypothetical protein
MKAKTDRAAAYRFGDYTRAAEARANPFKPFDDLVFSRSDVLKVWIACTIASMSGVQLTYLAARVPPLFPAISAERRRRREMEGDA